MCKFFENILGSLFTSNKNQSNDNTGNDNFRSNINVAGNNYGPIAGRDLSMNQDQKVDKDKVNEND
jgi:hypothetical protein